MRRFGAFVCVAAFLVGLANSAVLGLATGPRNPGADVEVSTDDIVFRVNGVLSSEGIVGDPVTINLTIENHGDVSSDKVQVSVSLENGKVIYFDNLTKPVPAGGELNLDVEWNTTNDALGDHTVNVTVTELISGDDNPDNNIGYKAFKLLPVPRAHVFADSITMAYNALVGDLIDVTVILKNDGTADMMDADYVKFLLGAAPLKDGVLTYAVPLPADNTTFARIIYTWDTNVPGTAGPYFITVHVLSSNFKSESHIINLTFPTPNVYVNKIEVDKTAITQGESITVTGKLRNNGTKDAVDEEVWFLIDQATSPSMANYTVGRTVPKNNADVNVVFNWNSTDAASGFHTFTIKVPGSSDPKASATTVSVEVIAKTPRVNLTGFTVTPGTVKSGETILLSAIVENTGSADAYNQEVRFYLTSVETYPLAIKKVNVKVGSSSWANATFIPEIGENDTTMTFFAVLVKSDQNETRSGNVRVISTVPLRPDLVVLSVDAERSLVIDNEYTITAVIANNGKAPALNFTVKFNLGFELPYVIKGLDLANGQNMTVNWTVRPTMEGKNLKLKVEIDATSAVTESDEFDNIFESIQDIAVRPQPKASIELTKAEPAKKSYKVTTGEKATVKLTVSLRNSGEKDGTVFLSLKEGLVVVLSENVTVRANSTQDFVYKWNITRAGTHTAKVIIEGSDAGRITSQITSVDLAEETPGFELLLVAAVAVIAVLLVRKRRK